MQIERNEVLEDFQEILGDLRNARNKTREAGEHVLANKMQRVIEAFEKLTPEEVLRMDEIMD